MLSLTLVLSLAFQERQLLFIEPIDFNDDGVEDAFPSHVSQMESVGQKIYLRSKKAPYVTVMDKTGKIQGKIGKRGFGPGEIDQGILAMAVFGHHLWIQGVNQRGRLQHFHRGKYLGSLPIDSVNISGFSLNSNVFAVSPEAVVYPASPTTGHLAKATTKEGIEIWLGDIYFDRGDINLLRKIPGMNDTNWVFDGHHYFCLFRYYPLLQKYNTDFEQIAAHPIETAYVQEVFAERVTNWEPGAKIKSPLPLFYDLKAKFGDLFFMTLQALIRMDEETGTVTNMYQFQGRGADFPRPWRNLNLRHFAILDDGTIILSGVFAWGHDLWRAKIAPW